MFISDVPQTEVDFSFAFLGCGFIQILGQINRLVKTVSNTNLVLLRHVKGPILLYYVYILRRRRTPQGLYKAAAHIFTR